jgi:hypothetical protein
MYFFMFKFQFFTNNKKRKKIYVPLKYDRLIKKNNIINKIYRIILCMSIYKKLQNFLISKNHICSHFDIQKNKFIWCQEYPCMTINFCDDAIYAQQSMIYLEKKLKNTHLCVKRCENTYPMSLDWCHNNKCIHKFCQKYDNKLPHILFEMKDFLNNNDHPCAYIPMLLDKNTDKKFHWCEKEICDYNKNEIVNNYVIDKLCESKNLEIHNNNNVKLMDFLIKRGHTCINITKNNPVEFSWCKSTICPGKK